MDKPKTKPLRYFYLHGDLHKKIHINRSADTIRAWNYPQAKLVTYLYSDVKKFGEKAFTTTEVAKMVNRSRKTVEWTLIDGHVHKPQNTYGLDENRNFFKYMWNEENIMELHSYLTTVHYGRPRNDGLITPLPLPNARELRAIIRQEGVTYVKQGDKFIPTWRANY